MFFNGFDMYDYYFSHCQYYHCSMLFLLFLSFLLFLLFLLAFLFPAFRNITKNWNCCLLILDKHELPTSSALRCPVRRQCRGLSYQWGVMRRRLGLVYIYVTTRLLYRGTFSIFAWHFEIFWKMLQGTLFTSQPDWCQILCSFENICNSTKTNKFKDRKVEQWNMYETSLHLKNINKNAINSEYFRIHRLQIKKQHIASESKSTTCGFLLTCVIFFGFISGTKFLFLHGCKEMRSRLKWQLKTIHKTQWHVIANQPAIFRSDLHVIWNLRVQ